MNNNELNKNSTLVIVPAYNAGEYMVELAKLIREFVCDSNLLFINDGSSDNTFELIKELKLNHISFPENRGKGSALMAGFNYALDNNYRSVLTIDSDLQLCLRKFPDFLPRIMGLGWLSVPEIFL